MLDFLGFFADSGRIMPPERRKSPPRRLRRGRNYKLFQNGFSAYLKQVVPLIKAHESLSMRSADCQNEPSDLFRHRLFQHSSSGFMAVSAAIEPIVIPTI